MISYSEIYYNFLKFKMATMCMLDTGKTAKDRNLHKIETFSQLRQSKKIYMFSVPARFLFWGRLRFSFIFYFEEEKKKFFFFFFFQ